METRKDIVMISCEEIDKKFDCFRIISSDETIKNGLISFKTTDDITLRHVYKKAYKNLTKYSKLELINVFEKKSKEYSDFCADVPIYYLCRLLLDGKPIPIIRLEEKTNEEPIKCAICNYTPAKLVHKHRKN